MDALDKIDRQLLRSLQADGRANFDQRVEQVGLSLTAHLNMRLEKRSEMHKHNPIDLLRASVQTWPEVVECVALTGETDCLLRVRTADKAHHSRFIMETRLKHPGVEDCKTSFVRDWVKVTIGVPV